MQGCSFAAMEEFTFLCVPLEQCNGVKKPPFPPHFASPPPWFGAGAGGVDAVAYDHRRSFSAAENDEKGNGWHYHYDGHGSARFAGEETKMDMLWEDFNEELSRAAGPPPCPLSKEWTKEAWLAGDGTPEMRRHAAATAASGSVIRRRRLSLLMMLKLLKKLILAHKSNAASRKAPPL
ncbi:hypothetical protein E2562_010848 [Oryza meyeriana var. granulata]|uniref:Uncharacterized protein n=1 Tax=Oryza meyeriana var. granulata TaxID=110450 RepID=A0A6G1BJQ6_9ORYZ|nr:hypothetical protein E2562_010848 [Oryza meyeriana var. granulata]